MGMDTREASIEALSEVVYRWTPPAELQIAGSEGGARVRKIAEEMLVAVRKVQGGEIQALPQEVFELRTEVQDLISELSKVQSALEQSTTARISLTARVEEQATALVEVEQGRLRVIAAAEQDGQRYREELARRDQLLKETSERAKHAEHDRDFFEGRSAALQASLDRLLDRAERIAQRKTIEDWAETLQQARHVLSNGSATL